jgi:hypothetical protein
MSEERAADDLEIVHNYMMSTNEFLHKLSVTKSKQDMYKLYKALRLCRYHRDDTIMRFGEPGDTFYIILGGEVAVQVPADHKEIFEDVYKLIKFMAVSFADILDPKDKTSKSAAVLIDFLTPSNTLKLLDGGR